MTVSVLGLGAMGSRVAARLTDAAHAVTVWNRTPRSADAIRGATAAETPRAAAAASSVVLSMVRDDDASRAVWDGPDGALAGLRPAALAIEMSTLTPGRARQWAAAVVERGARPLGAPVVGTRPHAESGALTVLAGGDADALRDARPVLDAFAGAVHHVGPVGAGMAAKLAVNALLAVQAAAVAEALAGLSAQGIAPADAARLLAQMPTASPAAARLGDMMAQGATAPNFPVSLVAKDLGYGRAMVEASGVQSDVVAAAERAFRRAEDTGSGDLDIAAIARLYGVPASP